MEKKTFHKEAVYQIYCRSYCDSNGDGIGDLPGIISKLDYIQSLGVGIIWLNPIYQSPQWDLGYDVADYYSINPEYGTMEDFDRLLSEAKKRGIRIVMDLVVNHTSDQHAWFLASKDPSSPYHSYYYWRKGKKNDGTVPPNNWTSMFSGSAWTYEPSINEWYLHLYAKQQPDLDWHNPKVLEEVEAILRFWLDKGVYGFRCDVINQIWKETLEDGKGSAMPHRGIEHYLMKDENHKILRRFYDDVFSHYDSVVIGETFEVDKENGLRFLNDKEMDMFFTFEHMGVDRLLQAIPVKFKAKKLREVLYRWQRDIPWNANYFENHDQPRSVDRFCSDEKYYLPASKALACLNFTLRGTPFVYQGQELGMLNLPPQEPEKSADVSARMVSQMLRGYHFPGFLRKKICQSIDRDRCRSPMQWDDSLSAGFSTNELTWLPIHPNYRTINVKAEEADPNSTLHYYRKLIALHRENEVLQLGDFLPLPSRGNVFAYLRKHEGKSILVLINLGKKKAETPKGLKWNGASILLANYDHVGLPTARKLFPYEALIIALN